MCVCVCVRASCRRTVEDKVTGKKTVLSDEELDVIKKIQSLDYPVLGYDPHQVLDSLYQLGYSTMDGCIQL